MAFGEVLGAAGRGDRSLGAPGAAPAPGGASEGGGGAWRDGESCFMGGSCCMIFPEFRMEQFCA